MDAASQRGIDDIREIRDRVVLQPVEGRSKVYILDEAHQLTDAAWNALLKLIEEPPPHLLFVFCTTELQKVLPTVRSRCQTFVFQRPRLPDLLKLLRRVADGEEMDVPDAALALRREIGARRSATGLDARPARRGDRRQISVQDVLQLLGAVEEEVLFRLCDLVVEGNSAARSSFSRSSRSRARTLAASWSTRSSTSENWSCHPPCSTKYFEVQRQHVVNNSNIPISQARCTPLH